MLHRLALLVAPVAAAALIFVGCTPTEAPGAAGQECTSDDDCADGLVCVERVCRTTDDGFNTGDDADLGDAGPNDEQGDVNAEDNQQDNDNQNQDNDNQENQNQNDESPFDCTPGDTRCESETTIERCLAPIDEEPYWSSSSCPETHECENGRCIDQFDDEECCPDGCADDEICHNCSCEPYDPDECTFQDQPCSQQGAIDNDFVCAPIDGVSDLRCLGLCSPGADNPDDTCPEDGTVCQFEDPNQANGHCVTACSVGEDDCPGDFMTCRYHDASTDEGLCQAQTDTTAPGEPCDPEDYFSCAGTAVCAAGFCQPTCRPFDQDETDCDDGYCLPFDANFGICANNSQIDDEGNCSAHFTTCEGDATGCFDETPNDPQSPDMVCRDLCRLNLDDEDCDGDQVCEQYDPNNPIIGNCIDD